MRVYQSNEAFHESAAVLSKQKIPSRFFDGVAHIYDTPFESKDKKDGTEAAK